MTAVSSTPTVPVPGAGTLPRFPLSRLRETSQLPALALSSVGLLGALTLGALSTIAMPMAAAHTQVTDASFGIAAPARAHVIPAPSAKPTHTPAARASRSVARTVLVPVTRMVKVTGAPESGIASWYGAAFAGRYTSDGEVFDPSQLTAAHKWLPFGTHVRVCTQSGACVIVRITDRGPYVPGRIIDLSYAAAQAIGMGGLAYVTITPIEAVTSYVPQTTYVEQTVAPAAPAPARASRSHVRTPIVLNDSQRHGMPVSYTRPAPVTRASVVIRAVGSDNPLQAPYAALAPLTTVGLFGALRGKSKLELDQVLDLPDTA